MTKNQNKIQLFTALLLSILLVNACSEQNLDKQNPNIKLIVEKGNNQNFGNVVAGEVISQRIYLKAEGKGKLIIKEVISDCGCTAAEWTKKPIKAGEKAYVEVQFDSYGYSGMQEKSITIKSTASNSILKINFFVNVK